DRDAERNGRRKTAQKDVQSDPFAGPGRDRERRREEERGGTGDDAETADRDSELRRELSEASRPFLEPGDDDGERALPHDEHEPDAASERAGDRPAEP